MPLYHQKSRSARAMLSNSAGFMWRGHLSTAPEASRHVSTPGGMLAFVEWARERCGRCLRPRRPSFPIGRPPAAPGRGKVSRLDLARICRYRARSRRGPARHGRRQGRNRGAGVGDAGRVLPRGSGRDGCGAIAAALYTSLPVAEQAHALRTCGARVAFAENVASARVLEKFLPPGDAVRWILLTGEAGKARRGTTLSKASARRANAFSLPIPPPSNAFARNSTIPTTPSFI